MFDEQEQRDFMNVALLNFIKETKKSCFPILLEGKIHLITTEKEIEN